MPYRTPRTCSYPGCQNLVRSGRCVEHPLAEPDYHISEHQRLYNTRRWKRIREAQLAREPWCANCLVFGFYTPATEVDHIDPHRGDRFKFFAGQLQSLCHVCHSRKTADEILNNPKDRGDQKVLNREWRACGHIRAKKIPKMENPV